MRRGMLIILIASIISCAQQQPVPSDHFYRLPDPQSSSVLDTPLVNGMVLVKQFQTDGLHIERAILYTNDEQSIELKQYRYHFWQDSPSRLVRDHLVAYLRDANMAPIVVTDNGSAAEVVVSGKIKQFEQRIWNNDAEAVVALEFRVDRATEVQPILLKDYRTQVAVDGDSMRATVTAFDKALLELFEAFLADAERELNASQ